MSGKEYVAMKISRNPKGEVTNVYREVLKLNIRLPEGCTGVLYAFKTKTAARKYYGKNIEFATIEEVDQCRK